MGASFTVEERRTLPGGTRAFFFRRDALKEQFGKEPSTVRCLAVKSALLGTRHPRKEKEAALQNVTGEPACQYGKILMTTQSEMEPSIKIEEMKSVAHNRRGRQSTGPRKACCRVPPPKGERPIYPTSNDLPNRFQTSSWYLLPKIGVDAAENGPLRGCPKLAES